jgi:hypothetical protein
MNNSSQLTIPQPPSDFSRKKIEILLRKYPDRVPIIISSKSIKHNVNRFITPLNMTISEFIVILRQKIQIVPSDAIYIFIKQKSKNTDNNTINTDIMVQPSATIGTLYDMYKDDNMVLNILFEKEAVFG